MQRGPEFQLYEQQAPVSIEENEDTITFKSGKTSAVINKKGPWGIQYLYNGKKMTGSGYKAMSHYGNCQ